MIQLNDIVFGNILNDLLIQDTITDIMIWNESIWVTDINKGHYKYYLERYNDQEIAEFKMIINRLPRQIALRMEVSYNDSHPIIDGEANYAMQGQLRFNCIHENLTGNGKNAIAIRKSFHGLRVNRNHLLESGYANKAFFDLIEALVLAGCNIMISGAAGSGKTELLRYIARYIPPQQAIITIEDTLEAYLSELYPDKNVLALKSNDFNSISCLLKPCLRQNPSWICVSETRGREVLELLEAASTGHHLISTIHTDCANNIASRMLEMSGVDLLNSQLLYQQIYSYIDIGIHLSYRNDSLGSHRKIVEIIELNVNDNFTPNTNYLYRYDFKNQQDIYGKISSSKIYRKLQENQVNTKALQGVFL